MSHNQTPSLYDDPYSEDINNSAPRPSPFNHGSNDPYSYYGSDNYFPSCSGDPTSSGDESWNHYTSAPVTALGHSGNSRWSKDSGYGSAPSCRGSGEVKPHSISAALRAHTPAGVRPVQGENTNKSDYHYCLHSDCDYQTKRQYDLDCHQKTHFTSSKLDCPYRGCSRTGKHGFDRKDHLREHLRKIHAKDIPKSTKRRRDPPGDIECYNTNSEALSELNAQGENYNEVPSPPYLLPMESVEYFSRNLKPVELSMTTNVAPPPTTTLELSKTTTVDISKTTTIELPKTTMTVGAEARSRKLERHRSLEDLRKVYLEYTPKAIKGTFGGTPNPPGDIERCKAELEAPCQLRAHDRDCKDVPPLPLVEPVKNSSRNRKSVELPKTTVLIGNASNLEYSQSPSSQDLYLAEESPGRASGRKISVSHIIGEEDKEFSRFTDLVRFRNVQVAPEPQTIRDGSISQGVKLNYEHNGLNPNNIERLPSTINADAERSTMTMTITGKHGVRDAVKPAKTVSEPDNEARPSIPDHLTHTTPLTVMDADDELMNSLPHDGIEQAQDSNDSSMVDDSCSNPNPVEHPANLMKAKDAAKTYFSGESIELAEDLGCNQTPIEIPEAAMNLHDTSMRFLMIPEDRISGHIHPVGLPGKIINVKDTDQLKTLGSLVEAVDSQYPHLAHNTQASTEPLRRAPQYDAYVMTLLSLRIELRVWLGRRAPSPTIHISTSDETLLEDGKQRIRWTCRCGRRLYDDFEEFRPGALEELEQMLNEQNRVRSPEGNGSGQHRGSSIRSLCNAAGGVVSSFTGSQPFRKKIPPPLPLHQHHTAGQERNSRSSAVRETLFLLMCIPYRKHGTRLVHMDLAELVSDETLFRKLRHEYQSIRGHWASYFSFWKMAEIQFVKFGLHKHQLIDIKEKNDLPPASLKNEYRYQPIPAETIPPIGTNYLMHLYEHPDHADDVPFCLERIPKKVREQLRLSPHQAPGLLGWGVYFAEGFNWPKFWVFGSVILSLSVLFGVCWSTLRQDIQGGFGITACMMVAVTFTTGVVQAAVEPHDRILGTNKGE